jgi:hypothetical protein
MRSRIRIVKPKGVDEANHEANESKKSAEPRAGKIVSTIKGWIAESQERKRNQRRSLPLITAVVLITFVAALAQSPTQPTARPVTAERSAIKVTIANENLPESVLLKPNEAQMVDWFILADGATPNGAEA